MQTIAAYKAEYRAIQAEIGKIHAQIWQKPGGWGSLQQEIEAKTRRLRTIEYVLKWLERNAA